MQGSGDDFATLAHVQTWALVAAYEAENAVGIRAFMSTRRAIGLSNMLDLHRIDDPSLISKRSLQILPLPKDSIEAEERRRTFWYLFYGDRWVSAGPGRSIEIREEEVRIMIRFSNLLTLSRSRRFYHALKANSNQESSSVVRLYSKPLREV